MLSDKDRELIGIGASLAANCQPCANFHLRAARIAGASDAEIGQAVKDALGVRRHATEEIARLAAQHLGRPVSDENRQENPLIGELVSISAACAVPSIPDFETHLAAARKLGATKGQILSAIKIAGAVKATAQRKAEEVTGHFMGTRPVKREDCCQAPEGWLAQAEQSAEEERARIGDCGPQCECHSKDKSKVSQGTENAESRKEVNLMSNTNSSKGKYILAALAGAAVGGSIVALSTRAVPNMMSGMMAKCKEMMAGMGATGCSTGEMCKRVMAESEQAAPQSTCHSEGASCHGGD